MKTNEVLEQMNNQEFLDKIYHFAYHRCASSFEAEELCSEILLSVISAVRKQERIDNFYGFVWTVARRVYADFSERRKKESGTLSIEGDELLLPARESEIEALIEEMTDKESLKKILAEISFLAEAYRRVMVMYYLEEKKVREIADRLKISETTVRQRLFSARNMVRKEVETMNSHTLTLKPMHLLFWGSGNPDGNDPGPKAERMISQNLIYLCKDRPRTAKELSEELCVPMPYIEEELEIQCGGANGSYGLLRKLDNGRYISNVHVVDYEEYAEAKRIYEKHMPEICGRLKTALKSHRNDILNFPFLSPQEDEKFVLWSMISPVAWGIRQEINDILREKYFTDVKSVEREFSSVAIACPDGGVYEFDFSGCDGIVGKSVGGFAYVFVRNIYNKWMDKHFGCANNLSLDRKLLMVLRAIGGLSVEELSENERELAAKCIECGYLRKRGDRLEPKMVVIRKEDFDQFNALPEKFHAGMRDIKEQIAKELAEFMRKRIPKHLINEYPIYAQLIAGTGMLSGMMDSCMQEGLLCRPENRLGAEGMLMVVER